MIRGKVLAAAVVASAVGLSGCGFQGLYSADLPGGANLGSHPYSMTIYFSDVLDLVPQSAVKVNDVSVGKVESVVLSGAKDDSGQPSTNGWTAKVKIAVNGDVKLPSNARAEVMMTSLLGEKYIALEQPLDTPATTYLHGGSSIKITSTKSAPEVEEVLGALSLLLNGGGLQQIKVITTELNKALKGNESAVRDLLAQLNTFVGTLDQQKDKITNALAAVNRLAITLTKQTRTIETTLDTFPKALEILKDDRTQLVTLLQSLSGLGTVATRVIDQTQTDLVSSLKSLSTPLEQLTAAGSDLPEALKIAGTFPFPIGTTLNAVKGDYANLNAFVNLDLSATLCGSLNIGCPTAPAASSTSGAQKVAGSSATASTGTASTSTGTGADSTSVLEPTLVGVGG